MSVVYISNVFNKYFHYLYYYPTSLNINYFWNLGFCSGVFYGIQVLSGFILTFHYTADTELSFSAIQSIMREVNYGWLYRYVHCNCCSFFFMFVYLHMIRSLVNVSFSYPRNSVWLSGVVIYLLMMASAFLGYILPWGQMSYWAASVITNLLGSIPIIGNFLAYMIWGGYGISNDTLVRFYSLHYMLPLVLAVFVFYHIFFLHFYKSSNPLNLYSISYMKINFYPYFWIKDLFSLFLIFFVFFFILFYYPEIFNHSDNYIEADPLVTPHHIVPEWYLLPFYGILKSFTSRLVGVVLMFFSILSLCFLFIIDFGTEKRSIDHNYNEIMNQDFIVSLFVMNFIYLGYLGMLVSSDYTHHFGLILSHLHFFYIYLMYSNETEEGVYRQYDSMDLTNSQILGFFLLLPIVTVLGVIEDFIDARKRYKEWKDVYFRNNLERKQLPFLYKNVQSYLDTMWQREYIRGNKCNRKSIFSLEKTKSLFDVASISAFHSHRFDFLRHVPLDHNILYFKRYYKFGYLKNYKNIVKYHNVKDYNLNNQYSNVLNLFFFENDHLSIFKESFDESNHKKQARYKRFFSKKEDLNIDIQDKGKWYYRIDTVSFLCKLCYHYSFVVPVTYIYSVIKNLVNKNTNNDNKKYSLKKMKRTSTYNMFSSYNDAIPMNSYNSILPIALDEFFRDYNIVTFFDGDLFITKKVLNDIINKKLNKEEDLEFTNSKHTQAIYREVIYNSSSLRSPLNSSFYLNK